MGHPEGAPTDATAKLAAVTNALSLMQVIAEAVTGYRRRLVEGGVGDESADRMAEEFHSTLMKQVEAGAAKHQAAATSRAAQPRRPR